MAGLFFVVIFSVFAQRFFKFADALAETFADLGQALGAEQKQKNQKNQAEFRQSYGSHKNVLSGSNEFRHLS